MTTISSAYHSDHVMSCLDEYALAQSPQLLLYDMGVSLACVQRLHLDTETPTGDTINHYADSYAFTNICSFITGHRCCLCYE